MTCAERNLKVATPGAESAVYDYPAVLKRSARPQLLWFEITEILIAVQEKINLSCY